MKWDKTEHFHEYKKLFLQIIYTRVISVLQIKHLVHIIKNLSDEKY